MKQLRQLPWELVKYLKVGVPSLLSRERRVRPLPSPSPFAWPAVEWVWRLGEVLGEPAPRSPAKHRPQQREAGAWLRSYHRRPQGWPWESCVHSPPQALGRLFPAWCRQGCSSLGRLSGMETNNLESVEIRANKRQKMGTDVSPGAAVLLGPSSLHKRPSEPAAAGLGPPASLGQASIPTSDTLPFCLFLPDSHGKRHEGRSIPRGGAGSGSPVCSLSVQVAVALLLAGSWPGSGIRGLLGAAGTQRQVWVPPSSPGHRFVIPEGDSPRPDSDSPPEVLLPAH